MVSACYLAMSAAEFASCRSFPTNCAWMACQFSSSGSGLSNLPRSLPKDTVVILSDQTPLADHDPHRICRELEDVLRRFSCRGVLLDFQRPGDAGLRELAAFLVRALPCPVAVAESYADGLESPVFLPPVPLRLPIREYLRPWQGREIWLDIAPDGEEIVVTEQGSRSASLPRPEFEAPHQDPQLCCHYRIDVTGDAVRFSLRRTNGDLALLMREAQEWGAVKFFGLWQELRETYGQ